MRRILEINSVCFVCLIDMIFNGDGGECNLHPNNRDIIATVVPKRNSRIFRCGLKYAAHSGPPLPGRFQSIPLVQTLSNSKFHIFITSTGLHPEVQQTASFGLGKVTLKGHGDVNTTRYFGFFVGKK